MENTNQPKMDSLYGKIYPFYLENNRLSNYLAYQVYSPGVDSHTSWVRRIRRNLRLLK